MLFCNVNFNVRNKKDLFENIGDGKTKVIVTVNAAFIVEANTSRKFFEILNRSYNTFDGMIPYFAAKLLAGLKLI